jgi:UDP-N-acetylmuramoylalanine--D-glutamate ligase
MTQACLRAAGKDAVLCGNIYGSGFTEVPLTEAALSCTHEQILVAEVSSFQLEWVSAFRPSAAAITNITPDHLDRHKTFDDYIAAKHRIFAAQGAHDFAIINADDPQVVPPPIPELLTFGRLGKDAVIEGTSLILDGETFRREEFAIYGDHNMMNAAAAALLASSVLAEGKRSMFYIRDEVVDALRSFRGIAHRMEVIGEKNGITVINNSMCTNPVAVIASSQAIPAAQHLLIGGSNKKLDFSPLVAYQIGSGYKHRFYLYGRDAAAVRKQLADDWPVFETMEEAFQAAVRNAKAGEVIMLAPGCASMDQFRDFEDRGNVFRSIAKEWLEL